MCLFVLCEHCFGVCKSLICNYAQKKLVGRWCVVKVVVAPDSYKGCLSAKDIAECIEQGILKFDKAIEVVKVPMADGGEGLVSTLVDATKGEFIRTKVCDPLLREVEATYGVLGDGETFVIELAEASGLPLLTKAEKNPLITSTYGTGQLINDALDKGCKKMIIGIGGSATNDGGAGLLRALGMRFLNKEGKDIPEGGQALAKLHTIDISHLNKKVLGCEIHVASDVQNTLCGEQGAAYVFALQKGASGEDVEVLDQALLNYAHVLKKEIGIDVLDKAGAGAAGGTGAALMALGATLQPGIDIVIRETGLAKLLENADLVFTGEGKIDIQTQFGKTPYGVAREAKKRGVPVIAICGERAAGYEALYSKGITSVFCLANRPMSLQESMQECKELLVEITELIMKVVRI